MSEVALGLFLLSLVVHSLVLSNKLRELHSRLSELESWWRQSARRED